MWKVHTINHFGVLFSEDEVDSGAYNSGDETVPLIPLSTIRNPPRPDPEQVIVTPVAAAAPLHVSPSDDDTVPLISAADNPAYSGELDSIMSSKPIPRPTWEVTPLVAIQKPEIDAGMASAGELKDSASSASSTSAVDDVTSESSSDSSVDLSPPVHEQPYEPLSPDEGEYRLTETGKKLSLSTIESAEEIPPLDPELDVKIPPKSDTAPGLSPISSPTSTGSEHLDVSPSFTNRATLPRPFLLPPASSCVVDIDIDDHPSLPDDDSSLSSADESDMHEPVAAVENEVMQGRAPHIVKDSLPEDLNTRHDELPDEENELMIKALSSPALHCPMSPTAEKRNESQVPGILEHSVSVEPTLLRSKPSEVPVADSNPNMPEFVPAPSDLSMDGLIAALSNYQPPPDRSQDVLIADKDDSIKVVSSSPREPSLSGDTDMLPLPSTNVPISASLDSQAESPEAESVEEETRPLNLSVSHDPGSLGMLADAEVEPEPLDDSIFEDRVETPTAVSWSSLPSQSVPLIPPPISEPSPSENNPTPSAEPIVKPEEIPVFHESPVAEIPLPSSNESSSVTADPPTFSWSSLPQQTVPLTPPISAKTHDIPPKFPETPQAMSLPEPTPKPTIEVDVGNSFTSMEAVAAHQTAQDVEIDPQQHLLSPELPRLHFEPTDPKTDEIEEDESNLAEPNINQSESSDIEIDLPHLSDNRNVSEVDVDTVIKKDMSSSVPDIVDAGNVRAIEPITNANESPVAVPAEVIEEEPISEAPKIETTLATEQQEASDTGVNLLSPVLTAEPEASPADVITHPIIASEVPSDTEPNMPPKPDTESFVDPVSTDAMSSLPVASIEIPIRLDPSAMPEIDSSVLKQTDDVWPDITKASAEQPHHDSLSTAEGMSTNEGTKEYSAQDLLETPVDIEGSIPPLDQSDLAVSADIPSSSEEVGSGANLPTVQVNAPFASEQFASQVEETGAFQSETPVVADVATDDSDNSEKSFEHFSSDEESSDEISPSGPISMPPTMEDGLQPSAADHLATPAVDHDKLDEEKDHEVSDGLKQEQHLPASLHVAPNGSAEGSPDKDNVPSVVPFQVSPANTCTTEEPESDGQTNTQINLTASGFAALPQDNQIAIASNEPEQSYNTEQMEDTPLPQSEEVSSDEVEVELSDSAELEVPSAHEMCIPPTNLPDDCPILDMPPIIRPVSPSKPSSAVVPVPSPTFDVKTTGPKHNEASIEDPAAIGVKADSAAPLTVDVHSTSMPLSDGHSPSQGSLSDLLDQVSPVMSSEGSALSPQALTSAVSHPGSDNGSDSSSDESTSDNPTSPVRSDGQTMAVDQPQSSSTEPPAEPVSSPSLPLSADNSTRNSLSSISEGLASLSGSHELLPLNLSINNLPSMLDAVSEPEDECESAENSPVMEATPVLPPVRMLDLPQHPISVDVSTSVDTSAVTPPALTSPVSGSHSDSSDDHTGSSSTSNSDNTAYDE